MVLGFSECLYVGSGTCTTKAGDNDGGLHNCR
jgi:hypothetical protein